MTTDRRNSVLSRRSIWHPNSSAVLMAAGWLLCASAQAATFGHSRLVSRAGEPLQINIPVTQLSTDDIASLRVVPAPASAWSEAGLTPPVALGSLRAALAPGYAPTTHIIQIRSDQIFNQPIADLLVDVHTTRGLQRYQVSLLAQGASPSIRAPVQQSGVQHQGNSAPGTASASLSAQIISVRTGDTMFAIAKQHAAPGVTIYQMMIALQRANSHAFIHDNINLVKAGAQLTMPDHDALTAISDREARRLFYEQVVAYQGSAQSAAAAPGPDTLAVKAVQNKEPGTSTQESASNLPTKALVSGDQLKLSSVASDAGAVPTSSGHGTTVPSGNAGNTASSNVAAVSGMTRNAQAATSTEAVSAGQSSSTGSTQPNQGVASQSGSLNQNAPDQDVRADDNLAMNKAIGDAKERISQLEANVKTLNQALQSQGEAAKDLVVDGAMGLRQSLTDVATAVTEATIGDEEHPDSAATGSAADSASSPKSISSQSTTIKSSKMEAIINWAQGHIWSVAIGIVGFIVLLIAWVLRRVSRAQSRTESAITPEMVREKLEQINLDLQSSPDDTSPSSR